jgi:hypothetical protein
MAMEDGMSLMSFALGLLYLNRSNGAAIGMLAKAVTRNRDAATDEPDEPQQPNRDAAGGAAASATTERQKPVRLFYFAM